MAMMQANINQYELTVNEAVQIDDIINLEGQPTLGQCKNVHS